MKKQLSIAKDSKGNEIRKGDTVEIINHSFLRKEIIGVQGVITKMEYNYENHVGCVDDRGEGWEEEYTMITFKTADGKIYCEDIPYIKKVKSGITYGIYNSVRKQFQFGIAEISKKDAMNKLFEIIGKDAYKWRFEAKRLPDLPFKTDKCQYFVNNGCSCNNELHDLGECIFKNGIVDKKAPLQCKFAKTN